MPNTYQKHVETVTCMCVPPYALTDAAQVGLHTAAPTIGYVGPALGAIGAVAQRCLEALAAEGVACKQQHGHT